MDTRYRQSTRLPVIILFSIIIVEYALSRSMSPTMVADYTLHLPDKAILQSKLRELTELALESGEGDKE